MGFVRIKIEQLKVEFDSINFDLLINIFCRLKAVNGAYTVALAAKHYSSDVNVYEYTY